MLPNTALPGTRRETLEKAPLGADIASLSASLLPLMARHNLKVLFSPASDEGVVHADASRNPTAAYKIRGALASALAAQRQSSTTVYTASAGNHGAGLALAAQMLSLKAIVFVPETAPNIKVQRIESFGAHVIRVGANFDQCLAAAREQIYELDSRATFVHPFDEASVVAGQGTIGLEIVEHARALASERRFSTLRIFVPVGGGGLAAGIASAVKNLWPNDLPRPEIIGVIDESSPASLLGISFGRPVRAIPNTIADGTRVELVGNTFLSLSPLIDHIVLVPRDAIVHTMREHFIKTGERLEASGALALAGETHVRSLDLLPYAESPLSFCVISGRNIDPEVFSETVHEKIYTAVSVQGRAAYDVVVPEQPGQLLKFLHVVDRFNITGLTYKQHTGSTDGRLRVEFETSPADLEHLDYKLRQEFPGSHQLQNGEHSLFSVGEPVAEHYHDELISLDDSPGSFLQCISGLSASSGLGSVGFLFYRKTPSKSSCVQSRAQVVIGLDPNYRQGGSFSH